MADHSAEIAKLESLLNAGATSMSVDGQQISIDLDSVRRRLADLKAEDDCTQTNNKRVRSAKISLGGAW